MIPVDGIALLRLVTIAYAAVLVVALAATLATIGAYLWRIAAALERVRGALVEVRVRSAPLAGHLEGLEHLTEEHIREFENATTAVERALGAYNEADLIEEQAASL